MKDKIIQIIKGYECDAYFGADLNHLKESDYEDVAEDIVKLFLIPHVSGQLVVDECKCIRFTGGDKWYSNGCKIHPNG